MSMQENDNKYSVYSGKESGYSSKEAQEAYKNYQNSKNAPLDIAVKVDEKSLKQQLDKAFKDCGFAIE